MQTVSIVLVLHVLLGFATVSLLLVPGAILELAAHTRDVPFIRKLYALASFHGKIGGPLGIVTVVAGFALARVAGIPLNSGWLIGAYVTYAILLAIGLGYHMRREMHVLALANTSPDGAASPELQAALADPMARPMMWTSCILWGFMVYLMVAKPW